MITLPGRGAWQDSTRNPGEQRFTQARDGFWAQPRSRGTRCGELHEALVLGRFRHRSAHSFRRKRYRPCAGRAEPAEDSGLLVERRVDPVAPQQIFGKELVRGRRRRTGRGGRAVAPATDRLRRPEAVERAGAEELALASSATTSCRDERDPGGTRRQSALSGEMSVPGFGPRVERKPGGNASPRCAASDRISLARRFG